jgi:hypothetical protein
MSAWHKKTTGYNGNRVEYEELETAMRESKHKKIPSIDNLIMELLNLYHKGAGDLNPHAILLKARH